MRKPEPHLVQRVNLACSDLTDRTGVDRYFSFEYMGSAEFEFGALGVALKEMRSQIKENWKPSLCKIEDKRVWYVGPDEHKQVAIDFFVDQLKPYGQRKARLQEPSRIFENYDTSEKTSWAQNVGWWCIDRGLVFVLFQKKEQAVNWLKGLRDT